jgi:hypothetical protein
MHSPDCDTKGLVILRPYDASKPLMVSGGGRSGTTALARACAALGLRHDWTDDSLNAEEVEIRDAWLAKSPEAVAKIRQQRGTGWVGKFPIAAHVARLFPALMEAADCNWICSLRDPINEVFYDRLTDPKKSVVEQLNYRLRQSESIIAGSNAAASTGVGSALVSYEAICDDRKREAILLRVYQWIHGGDSPDSQILEAAMSEVIPGDPRYGIGFSPRLAETYLPKIPANHE